MTATRFTELTDHRLHALLSCTATLLQKHQSSSSREHVSGLRPGRQRRHSSWRRTRAARAMSMPCTPPCPSASVGRPMIPFSFHSFLPTLVLTLHNLARGLRFSTCLSRFSHQCATQPTLRPSQTLAAPRCSTSCCASWPRTFLVGPSAACLRPLAATRPISCQWGFLLPATHCVSPTPRLRMLTDGRAGGQHLHRGHRREAARAGPRCRLSLAIHHACLVSRASNMFACSPCWPGIVKGLSGSQSFTFCLGVVACAIGRALWHQ